MILLAWPIFYVLDFKGEIGSPYGVLVVSNRQILRSFTYGFFKTAFAYSKALRSIFSDNSIGVVIDVGANIGDFTLAMSRLSKEVISIEPGRQNFVALNANLRRNHVLNVIPLQVAAHNRSEELFLHGSNSDLRVGVEQTGERVQGLDLDSIREKLRLTHIDLVKIDVQGHERSVLEGMAETLLQKSVELVVVEVHVARGVSEYDIISLLSKYGYRLLKRDAFLFDQPHLYFAPESFLRGVKGTHVHW